MFDKSKDLIYSRRIRCTKSLGSVHGHLKSIDKLFTLQTVSLDITYSEIADLIVISCLRLGSTQTAHNFFDTFSHSQSGQLLGDDIPLIPSQMSTHCTVRCGEVGVYAVTRRDDFGLLMPCYACRGVQCNGIPNELQTVLVPVAGFRLQEVTGRIGAIDFKSIIFREILASLGPPQIMQNG